MLDVQVVARVLRFGGARRGDGRCRPFSGEGEEVGQQLVAVGAADRLGMELHAPQRQVAVAHAHHDAVVGPRQLLEVVRKRRDRQRVVAHDVERRGNAREEVDALVPDGRDAPVHGLGRAAHLAAEELAEALVAEAHAEHRQTAVEDDAGAHTEVAVSVGPTRSGRDDGGIELVESEVGPRGVVPDNGRRMPAHLADQLVEVVGERVVVVDEDHAHQAALPSEVSASMIRSSIRHVSAMIRSYSCFMKVRSRPLASANRAALCCTTPIR